MKWSTWVGGLLLALLIEPLMLRVGWIPVERTLVVKAEAISSGEGVIGLRQTRMPATRRRP